LGLYSRKAEEKANIALNDSVSKLGKELAGVHRKKKKILSTAKKVYTEEGENARQIRIATKHD